MDTTRKYIVWDFDGTLANRVDGWSGALQDVLRVMEPAQLASLDQIRPYLKSGFPWHAPENAHPAQSAEDWWEELLPVFLRAFRGLGAAPARAMELAQAVRGHYLDISRWQLFPDALPALAALSSQGWEHLLLTNNVPELPALIEQLSLADSFTAVFNSGQTGYEKPNLKAYHNVLNWIGQDSQVWMIGDNYKTDILGAQKVGIAGILIRQTHPDADYSCLDLEQAVQIITTAAPHS